MELIVDRLPFKGIWFTAWGGDTAGENHHHDNIAQRYAYDFLIVNKGQTHLGDGSINGNYFSYGTDIVAPKKGEIYDIVNGMEDSVPSPGSVQEADPPGGNTIWIKHDENIFSFYAHLLNGSIRVSKGDLVRPGDVIAKCGNSGRSSEPHLHFHVQDSPDLQNGTGIKVGFKSIMTGTDEETNYFPVKGDYLCQP